MYQWKKFQFFEEKIMGKSSSPSMAKELQEKVVCSTSGRGHMLIGSQNAIVHVLDRTLNLSHSFQAHSVNLFYMQQLKQRNMLVTLGEDETSPQLATTFLKIYDFDKIEPEGSSTSGPSCLGTIRVFTNKFPEAKITSFLVFEEAPPTLLICIGLDSGFIYCIWGDLARDRVARLKLQVDSFPDSKASLAVTGLGFRADASTLQLFAITPSSIVLFDMHEQPPPKHVVDQIGCSGSCVTMSNNQDLVIGLTEAVYFYEADGRGPCWAFEGKKRYIGWFRGYLLVAMADEKQPGRNVFNIYDLKNKLIAYSAPVGNLAHVLCEWGNILILTEDRDALCIREKDMESKLELLFRKNLYLVAINLVQSQQDVAATAEVRRKYGDHLYGKQDYDEAMGQYIRTIGQLEPSYVIQKFLDAQRIHNLTNYLECLHDKGLATPDHTTLLLNCYTKLKDLGKLNKFLKGEEGVKGELRFDVETAVKVCRSAGYYEHALHVSKRAGEHEWYLKILLEDMGRYEEALQYISSLSLEGARDWLKQYGKTLISHKPMEMIPLLMKLCTGDMEKASSSNSSIPIRLPSPIDFVHVFIDQPKWLLTFLEQYTDKVKDSPAHVEIHNTLLELYLSENLGMPSFSQSSMEAIDQFGGGMNKKESIKVSPALKSSMSRTASRKAKEVHTEVASAVEERNERLNKGLALMKTGWGPFEQSPQYDVDLAVVLCEMYKFKEGLLFLYEKMKLYKEVIACYMQGEDYQGLISFCKRFGDSSKGGDSSLWADVLNYFGELGKDCSMEVKEVLIYIERDNLLPPLIVLQTLAKNPALSLSVVKDYLARQFDKEFQMIEEDRKATEKYQEDTATMRKEIKDLQTNACIFQLSKCTACTSALDLPAVHFLCMHSFHQRCLGDNELECPLCAPANRTLVETKRTLEQSSNDHDRFFQLVRNSNDGFSVMADYFGRGILNRTHVASNNSLAMPRV